MVYIKVIFFYFWIYLICLDFNDEKFITKIRVLFGDNEFHSAFSFNEELAKEKCCFEAYEKLKKIKIKESEKLMN